MLNKIANKIDNNDDDNKNHNLINIIDKDKNDKLTLSFILNIIDGIRETPGRILIITSNNYYSLDPALIRPGRIDMTLEMKNASIDVIKEMYNHYYKDILTDDMCLDMKDYVISHAKIVNLRLENSDKNDFLIALMKEFSLYENNAINININSNNSNCSNNNNTNNNCNNNNINNINVISI